MFVHQRCDHLQQQAHQAQQLFALPDALQGRFHGAAAGQCVLKIRLHVADAAHAAHPHSVLKVMVQAAVVQIDGAHHGFHSVPHHQLCMGEAGRPLADHHA